MTQFYGTLTSEKTEREEKNMQLVRKGAGECMVLLENDGVLPLKKIGKIALYGAGARHTIKGGTGSGDVNNRTNINIYQGLKNGGFQITEPSAAWLADYEARYEQARQNWRNEILLKTEEECGGNFFEGYSTTPFSIPAGAPIDKAAARTDGADAAVYVLSRIAGENADRHDVPGDYYITEEEREQIDRTINMTSSLFRKHNGK